MFQANVVTGEVCGSVVDLSLPGVVPFELERKYRSLSKHNGLLGWNWTSPFDQGLHLARPGLVYRDQWGQETPLAPAANSNDGLVASAGNLRLSRAAGELVLHAPPLTLHYPLPKPGASSFLRPQKIVDGYGNALLFTLNEAGLPERLVDTMGRHLRILYDNTARIAEIRRRSSTSSAEQLLLRYGYDRFGDLRTMSDAAGSYHFEYADHLVVRWTYPSGLSGYATYDQHGRCTRLWHDGGRRYRQLDYDDRRRTTRVTNGFGNSTLYRHNEGKVVTETIDPLGGVETNAYDANNGLLATFNALGRPTPLTVLDPENRMLSVTDAQGATTVFHEDEHGRVRAKVDACGGTWRWDYDTQGNLIGVETPSGVRSDLVYDSRGILSEVRDFCGRRMIQSQSSGGRTVTVHDDLGMIVKLEYDEIGNVVAATDGEGATRRVLRDGVGRVVGSQWPDRTGIAYEYDQAGNLTRVVDELGRQTRLEYDEFGKCVVVQWPSGHAVRYEYDLDDNPTAIINAKGEAHRFAYDSVGRVVGQEFFDGTRETYAYDAVGRLVGIVDGNGAATTIIRDEVGSIVEKRYAAGDADHFDYDQLRRLVRGRNEATTIEFEWDGDGNLTREVQGELVLTSSYDPGGKRRSLKTSQGRSIDYDYDIRGRLVRITDSATGSHSFEFDSADRLVAHSYPNGARLELRYDDRNRIVEQSLSTGSKVLLRRAYEFDAADQLLQVASEADGEERLAYDHRGALLTTHRNGSAERYGYDPTGNLAFSSECGALSYAAGDRLVGGPDGSRDYDGCGATVTDGSGARHFQYDGAGRLRRVMSQGRTIAHYEYDVLGRRTRKAIEGKDTRFAWDGFSVLQEVTGRDLTEYLVLPDTFLPLSRRVGDTVEHLVADRRGCVIGIMDEKGSLVARFEYTAFGRLRASSDGRRSHPFRLRGQYYDKETGLHYNLHRYYDAQTGRFLTRDPIGLEGGRNLYSYGPNPITWEDPFGLSSECQGDVFYRAMSDDEKAKVMADCQLHAREGKKCPEGPYVTQARKYAQSAINEKPDMYKHLVEICTKPGTVTRMNYSPYACRNGSQAGHFPSLPDVMSGNPDRIEHKMERVGRPDEGLNYGLSKGKGLDQFNGEVESMKVVGTNESCVPKRNP